MISQRAGLASVLLSPLKEYSCPHCHAVKRLRGAHAFANVACAACGEEWRPRDEIGGYRLLETLARTGLAMIFRASEPASGALLAVKVLRPPFGFTSDDLIRFAKEVEILAALEHPHWQRVFAGGIEEDLAWIAMEWLPDGSLLDLLAARGRLGETEVLQFGAQIASALAAAHSAGLQHHDLQIASCLLADAETVKVGGFAEAVFYERAGEEVGTVWGRLCCAPPERIFGDPEDSRSEIYALGAILFQMLTGALPYEGETMPELFYVRLGGSSLRLEDFVSPIRKSTAQVVERMFAIGPGQRFQSWDEALEGLTNALATLSQSRSPTLARPGAIATPVARKVPKAPSYSAASGAWFTILMLLGIAGFAGWFAWKHWNPPEPLTAPVIVVAEVPVAKEPVAKVPAVAIPATQPPPVVIAPATTPAPVVAVIEKPAIPAPARPKKDWSGWNTFILVSPKKPKGGVQGEAHPIPGTDNLRIIGNSTGVEGGHDECVFYALSFTGDWTLTAHIVANKGFAALCARAGPGSEQPCVAVIINTDGKVKSAIRNAPEAKAGIKMLTATERPEWLRLTRRGTTLTAFYGPRKDQWTEAAVLTVPALPTTVPAGFMVWSGTKDKAAATFDEIVWTSEK